VDWFPAFDSSMDDILQHFQKQPDWIFHFESDFPLLPGGLEKSAIPTVCFQVDSYTYLKRRLRWSSLFDHAAVFHPGHEILFNEGGHPGAFLLPHAVRRALYDVADLPREFEVGFVGQTRGAIYHKREELITELARTFRMNDWSRTYSLEEVAEVYRRSRVAVNIGRDDFPQDANMRVFEILASGALLITSLPSELSGVGLEEGVHFVGYRKASEVFPLVRRFLGDEAARLRIVRAARARILEEHTYDHRVEQLLQRLQEAGTRKLAPARHWSESRTRLVYLDFFAAHALLDCAESQFRYIAGRGFRETVEGAALLAKARMKQFKTAWQERGLS